MPSHTCRVSFTDCQGVEHAVEIAASSLYEACVLALAQFRRCGFAETVFGPATMLRVVVKAPETAQMVSVGKLHAWLSGACRSPNEQVVRKKLREVLGSV